jgi:nucleotide-binding universal stress UspA family protein
MSVAKASQTGADGAAPQGAERFVDVLCALDGTPDSIAAVEQAAELARPDGHLTLLEVTSFDSEGSYRPPAIGPLKAKGIIDRGIQIAEQAGVRSTVEVDPASPPSRVVLDWAAERDLLALGAPSTSWLGGMFTGRVAVTAETSFTTPLLVARATQAGEQFAQRILVASDGLPGSDELVELAGRLARARGAGVVLFHATGLESKARRRRVEEQARRLEPAVDGASELRLQAGNARAIISDAAGAAGASLIMMGSRRLKGLRAVGSVSRRVVHQGHCSVLLVPPERLGLR